jgi:CRP-like cAMP-binding protein
LANVCEVALVSLRQAGALSEPGRAALIAFSAKTIEVLAGWGQLMRVRSLTPRLAAALVLMARDQDSTRIQLPGQRVLAELLAVTRESVGRSLDELCAIGLVTRVGRGAVDVNLAELSAWLRGEKPT